MRPAEAQPKSDLSLPMFRGEEHPCPYLPGLTAQSIFTFPLELDGADYQLLMDSGFRRSGDFFYRPDCFDCHACTPIRVLVDRFRPSRSQRRAVRRNSDVRLRIGTPRLDDERWNLYRRYEAHQHDRRMIDSREEFVGFFCESPIETIEMEYRIGRRLAGIGIVDVSPTALSSVYFYFEPDYARRSLGVYSAVCEIEECRRRGLPFWYVGYYVRGCSKMDYKSNFRPNEFLRPDGTWSEHEPTTHL